MRLAINNENPDCKYFVAFLSVEQHGIRYIYILILITEFMFCSSLLFILLLLSYLDVFKFVIFRVLDLFDSKLFHTTLSIYYHIIFHYS